MEMQIKPESQGIVYEGYDRDFIQCVFEDANVEGRNERYEFKCRPELECCGRICCVPQEAIVPFWLMILFIVLALLLLFAILSTIAWLCRKKKEAPPKPEKVYEYRRDVRNGNGDHSNVGYQSIKQSDTEARKNDEKLNMENAYSTPSDNIEKRTMRLYGNPVYGKDSSYNRGGDLIYDRPGDAYDTSLRNGTGATYRSELIVPVEKTTHLSTSERRNNSETFTPEIPRSGPPKTGYYHETFEEKFEEKYEVEEEEPSDTDSRDLL